MIDPGEAGGYEIAARAGTAFEAHAIAAALDEAGIATRIIEPSASALDEALRSTREPFLVLVPAEALTAAGQALTSLASEGNANEDEAVHGGDGSSYQRRMPLPAKVAFVVVLALVLLMIIGGLIIGGQMLRGG